MDCPACQRETPEEAQFCMHCGARVTPGTAPERDPRAYTPKHLADEILRRKAALEGERKQVTVLFADVKGSMELAEELDPEEWHAVLERFFEILTDGVHRFEGTVNQYTGDGIMALFGAPIAHEDHAQRACHAALHLRDELRGYAVGLRESRGLEFAVRIGLNSGEVVVGKIGDDLRMDYTAQGHSVGIAARLQQLAEPGTIRLSEQTAGLVEGYFELEDQGQTRLAGVKETVGVYGLLGLGALRTRLDVSRARGFSRFVGRADELDALESALEGALRGHGRVAGVVAEAGIGKSRLCHELSESCRARGVAIHETRGIAHGRQMPMLPILELLRSVFGIEDGDPGATAREKITDHLLRLKGEDLQAELPLVFDLMGVPDPARPLEPIDPELHHQRIVAAVLRAVLASREPAVILIEDLQWLDATSDDILAQLVRSASASARLIVVNFRPEYSAAWMEEPHYLGIPLLALSSEEIRELLADLLGNHQSVARLPELIEARTRGNPFFIEEVVQMLVDTGFLSGSRGARRLVRPLEAIAVPESVRAVLSARIDRLREPERHVLLTASVIGKQVPLPLLRRVAELSEPELDAALTRLGETEFLHEASRFPHVEYEFKHPLTEAVAYETQLRGTRASVHGAVARAIEEGERDRLEQQSARLAHHWEAAGEALEAARWHQRAAEWIGLAQPAEALRHWRRVRKLAGRLDSRAAAEQLGLACYQTLNFGWRLGLSEDEMRSTVAECRNSAARIGPALIVRVLCAYAVCLNLRGAVRENIEPLTEALQIARAERSTDMEIDVSITLGESMWLLGRLEEAESFCTRVIELVGQDPAHQNFRGTSSYLESLAKRGAVRAELGRHREAREDLEEAIRLSEDRSLDESLLLSLMMAVSSGELSGAGSESLPRARRLSQLALKSGSSLWTLDASTFAGMAHASSAHWVEAIGLLEHVVERIEERGFPKQGLGRALTALARAYLGAERLAEAGKAAERAVRTCRTGGMKSWECMARLVLARIRLAAEGKSARRKVRAGLERAEQLVEETAAEGYRPFICEVRSMLARVAGDTDAAQTELREARRLFSEMGATEHAERVERELSATD